MEITPAHGAVLATAVGAAFIHNMWMGIKVGQARKQYKVPYPHCYAAADNPNADAFNCVQRAHQNSLENLPTFYAMLLLAGTRYPISASIAGVVYLLGRIAYFKGYSTGDPKARMRGSFMYFGSLGLMGMVIRWSAELLMPLMK